MAKKFVLKIKVFILGFDSLPGKYRALYANFEAAKGARENVGEAMRAIMGEISERARIHLKEEALRDLAAESCRDQGTHNSLNYILS